MLDGVLDAIPNAKVSVVGIARNHVTLMPEPYVDRLAGALESRTAIILDPMLATGGSSAAAVAAVKQAGARSVTLVCLVAAPVGIERVHDEHPDVHIVCAAAERELEEAASESRRFSNRRSASTISAASRSRWSSACWPGSTRWR